MISLTGRVDFVIGKISNLICLIICGSLFIKEEEHMPSRRSNFLFIFLSSLSIFLLVIFLISFIGTQSQERTPRAHQRLALKTQSMEQNEATSKFRKDQSDSAPQLGYFLQSPEEVLSEIKTNPKTDHFFWKEVQEDLALIIKEKFPELKLSERELRELTETIKMIQKSMVEMRDLERARGNTETIRRIRGGLDQALDSFGEITQMDAAEFILRGRPKSGLDNEDPDNVDIVKEYLTDLKP